MSASQGGHGEILGAASPEYAGVVRDALSRTAVAAAQSFAELEQNDRDYVEVLNRRSAELSLTLKRCAVTRRPIMAPDIAMHAKQRRILKAAWWRHRRHCASPERAVSALLNIRSVIVRPVIIEADEIALPDIGVIATRLYLDNSPPSRTIRLF